MGLPSQNITIAVLPFSNLSTDAANEYFSDGITESIMTLLAKSDQFRVTARSSSFTFKERAVDARTIGQQLGVRYILDGSVRRAGDTVRVNAQLIDTTTGFQNWSDQFDRRIDVIFQVEDAIAQHIAAQLKAQLGNSTTREPNSEAYQHYLKGQYYFNKHTPESTLLAIEQFELAIKVDPNYAKAHCGLANCYFNQANRAQLPGLTTYPKAKALVKKALELEPDLVEAHVQLAMIRMYYDLNWDSAGLSFETALSLKREFPTVYNAYGWYLAGLGYYEEAMAVFVKALEYNPLSLFLQNSIGDLYRYMGQFQLAIQQYKKVLQLAPDFRMSLENLGACYGYLGDYEKSIYYLKEYKKHVKHPLGGSASLGYTYAKAGRLEEALACLEALKQRALEEPEKDLNPDFYLMYIGLGELDKAAVYLEACFESRQGLIFILCDPIMKPLRNKPLYQSILKQINFGERRFIPIPDLVEDQAEKITIQTELKETLCIDKRDFLYAEAQNNYSKIVWQEQNVLKERLLRLSLSRLADQLSSAQIQRCHRSFLVNLETTFKVRGNARGYKLKCAIHGYEIPVSRSFIPVILKQLKFNP